MPGFFSFQQIVYQPQDSTPNEKATKFQDAAAHCSSVISRNWEIGRFAFPKPRRADNTRIEPDFVCPIFVLPKPSPLHRIFRTYRGHSPFRKGECPPREEHWVWKE